MKRILSIIALVLFGLQVQAQQDPLFSQYMFNKLLLNPAYAGSHDQLSMVALWRQQWSGWDGAPVTQSFGIHAPSSDLRHGFGLHIYNDKVGFTSNTLAALNYAYRIPIQKGHLALGLNAGMNVYSVRVSEVETWQAGDVSFGNGEDFSKWLFTAGPGLYFSSDLWYAGISAPNIMPTKLYDPFYEQLIARKSKHYFAFAGIALPLSPWLKFKPSFMLKYAAGAPLNLDLSAAFFIKERVWIGGSYRPDNALVAIFEIYLNPQLRLGYAYDYGLNQLSDFNTGSHEFMLGFDFGFQKNKMVSPKLF